MYIYIDVRSTAADPFRRHRRGNVALDSGFQDAGIFMSLFWFHVWLAAQPMCPEVGRPNQKHYRKTLQMTPE